MEVVPAVQMKDNSPFQRHDVAEWSHMDRLTGMMETARVETDRWAASTPTTAHAYGKVVDSRNRSLPDGSAQQRQRQQLEVFQTKGPGGSLQVIRTQTVTSTNSSWRGSALITQGGRAPLPAITQDFGNLQLTLNPLDLTSEKSKGSVGRSGSIGGRRPPSRPRSLIGKVTTPQAIEENDAVDAGRRLVTRICQQGAEEEIKRPTISSIRELTSSISSRSSSSQISNGHSNVCRKKSSSIEDLHNGNSEERTDDEDGLKRSSKVRRSLQFPLKRLEARGGVGKLLQDLEESNKRNTVDGRIARKSFEALENVLKRGNNIFDTLNKSETEDSDSLEGNGKASVNNVSLDSFSKKFAIAKKRHSYVDGLIRNDEESSTDEGKNKSPATKRHSFVTVESLKEVRGRLKRLNSPLDGLDVESGVEEIEDDGIGTDESTNKPSTTEAPPTKVKSYVYGMEAVSNGSRVPLPGTGSLESRTSNKNCNNGIRSEEWYNRRKSYGFEQVSSEHANDSSSTLSSKGDESKLESTDSGICRSSEGFNVPSWSRKPATAAWNKSESSTIQIKSRSGEDNGDEKRKTSVVNFCGGKLQTRDDFEEKSQQHVTVSIPVVQDVESPTVGSRRLFYQQLAQGMTVSVERAKKLDPVPTVTATRLVGDDWWMKPNRAFGDEDWQVPSKLLSSAMKRHSFAGDNSWKQLNGNNDSEAESWHRLNQPVDPETKRHSIAVDERKYVKDEETGSDLVSYSQLDDNSVSKKHKKVEFCKTEVHFAAEPGRFNIVETDEKPPSTNMFRRRRRQTNPMPDPARNSNLPEVRFGDSFYEKQLLSQEAPVRPTTLRLGAREDEEDFTAEKPSLRSRKGEEVNEEENNLDASPDSKPRSILKNYSRLSPTEDAPHGEEQDEKWGVRLRPIAKETSSPVWKSTVNVGSRDAVMPLEYSGQSELQKLLRSLRPANQRKHDLLLAARHGSKVAEKVSDWSVAERIRHVEQVASETRGFSTRVNFGAGEATVVDEQTSLPNQRLFQISDRPKPVWQRREEALIAGDASKHLANKRNAGLVVQIGQNANQTEYPANVSDGRRNTMITIDLTPSPTVTEIKSLTKTDDALDRKSSYSNGKLNSPSLIMKTIHGTQMEENEAPLRSQAQTSSFRSREEPARGNFVIKGGIRCYGDVKNSGKTNVRRHSMVIRDRGEADGEGNSSNKPSVLDRSHSECKYWGESTERSQEDEVIVSSRLRNLDIHNEQVNTGNLAKTNEQYDSRVYIKENRYGDASYTRSSDPSSAKTNIKENGYTSVKMIKDVPTDIKTDPKENGLDMIVPGHLDAWRALYCDIDSELSDDSEKADEEVRSYMSTTEGEGASSEVSGSWSRATALRHVQKQGYSDPVENQGPLHSSVTTAKLQSYGESSRLRAVETMVSTRSGHPKITSIALRYDGDQSATRDLADSFKFTSRTTISPERRHSSYHESENMPHPREMISSSAFLEAQSSFSKQESDHGKQERRSYCEAEKAQQKAFTNATSAFEKQRFIARRSQSPPAQGSLSSSKMVSSYDRKVSSRSQSPELSTKQSPCMEEATLLVSIPRKETTTQERKFNCYDSPTHSSEAKQPYESSSSHHVDIRSRATSTQVQCEVGAVIKTSLGPMKKVTSPSKNSFVNKDFIGRVGSESPVYQNKVSASSSSLKPASLKDITQVSTKTRTGSPVYQNKESFPSESCSRTRRPKPKGTEPETKLTECGLEADETDSAILEELTRAADQILQAVNGYTDEESRRASSEDEHTRRIRERRILGTISEAPSSTHKTSDTVKTNGSTSRRMQRTSSKTKLGPTSSTSSVESFTREVPKKASSKTDRGSSTNSNRSATSSRTARMVQRASSRELLLQAHASSSEDVASGTESKKPRAPPPRRSRTSSNSNKLPTSKSRDVQKDTTSSRSTRERTSVVKTKSRDATISSYEGRRKTPETKQYPIKEKTIPGVGSLIANRERTSSSRKSTTATRTKKSSSSRSEVLSPTKREQVK